MVMDPAPSGWISALDPQTGQIKWKYHADAPILAGLTPTAGGILLTGDFSGNFLALDSSSGRLLLKKGTAGSISGGVVTYGIEGRQYIAFTSGSVSRSIGGSGSPTIVILALGARPGASRARGPESNQADRTHPVGGNVANISHGRNLYASNCSMCHGANGEGGVAKSLRGIRQRMTWESAMKQLQNPQPPMPKLFPGQLSEQDLRDVLTFVRTL
jgi:alcohol dehydrogenase (cytochrome c)